MSTFHRVDQRGAGVGPEAQTDNRLPPGLSVIVITGLSTLSWVVLISIVLAVRALL